MKRNEYDAMKMNQALRDILLEASEQELRDAFVGTDEKFDALASHGRTIIQRALAKTDDANNLKDLRRGLGTLIQMLRRRERISPEQLAAQARIDLAELHQIEGDPNFNPNPRTIFQLEQYFKLPPRCLVVLSGSVRVENEVREEVVRFAANSQDIAKLNREEKKLLNQFVKFLREHTDR